MASFLQRWFCRAYRVLLYTYPSDFRRRYGGEMAQVFGARCRVVAQTQGLRGLLRFGVSSGGDWLSTAIREGFASMRVTDPSTVVAEHTLDGVPVFYTCGSFIPPRGALINGGVISLAVFSAVSLLIGHGGRHRTLLIGSHHPSPHLLPVARPAVPSTDLTTEIEWEFPPDSDVGRKLASIYFRLLLVLGALDADHDLVLSPTEIANAPAVLRKLDLNHDGKLSPEECGQNFGDAPKGASAAELTKSVTGLGKNSNGKLQKSEAPERMQGLFDRAGANQDGVLTENEIRKLASGQNASRVAKLDSQFVKRARLVFMRLHPVLAALDADHNGEISASEIKNAPAALKTLDKNGDGQLTADELLPDAVASQVALFMSLDKNGDGRISKDERSNAYAELFRDLLDGADRNKDGFVTWEELKNEVRRRADLNKDGVVTWEELQTSVGSGAIGPGGPGRDYSPKRRK